MIITMVKQKHTLSESDKYMTGEDYNPIQDCLEYFLKTGSNKFVGQGMIGSHRPTIFWPRLWAGEAGTGVNWFWHVSAAASWASKFRKTSSLSNILRKLCEHLIGLLWSCYLKSQAYCQTRVLENGNDFTFPSSDIRAGDGKQGCNNERAGVQLWTLPRSIRTHRDNF